MHEWVVIAQHTSFRFFTQDVVQVYLCSSRSCHINNLDLFTYCIGKMAAVFLLQVDKTMPAGYSSTTQTFLNIKNADPGVRDVLLKGVLTVRRTSKQFSRTLVDLTLEQTINTDDVLVSRRGGMIHCTSSLSARRKWIATNSFRRRIDSHSFKKAGLQQKFQ